MSTTDSRSDDRLENYDGRSTKEKGVHLCNPFERMVGHAWLEHSTLRLKSPRLSAPRVRCTVHTSGTPGASPSDDEIMGLRFRRSVKPMPGVLIALTRRGLGTTIGGRGIHTMIGRDRVTNTIGVPGTGLSYASTESAPHTNAPRPMPTSLPGVLVLIGLGWGLMCGAYMGHLIAGAAIGGASGFVVGLALLLRMRKKSRAPE